MRVVVAVTSPDGAWRIHVDLADGRTDVFRDTAYVGEARYVPRVGWVAVAPDEPAVRAALAQATAELLPFEAVMRSREP